jgi:hypothetical protein
MRKRIAAVFLATSVALSPVILAAPAQATDCHVVAGRGCGGTDCNWLCQIGRLLGNIAQGLSKCC